MRGPATGRTFYRLVRTNPPTGIDWLPPAKLPRKALRPASDPLAEHWNEGLSVWETLDRARQEAAVLAARHGGKSHFRYVARLDFGFYTSVECDDTIKTPLHWTLFGPTDEIIDAMTSSGARV